MSKRGLLLLTVSLAAVALVAASCSSGDEAASTTSSSATTASTTSTTEAPTTSEEPTTTVDPVAEAEEAAAQAVLDKADAWSQCVADVSSCDPIAALSDTTTGASLVVLSDSLYSWQEKGWETRPPVNPERNRVEIVNVALSEDGDSAVVISCTIDGGIIVDPDGGPGGTEVIINDEVGSLLSRSDVVVGDDGVWRVQDTEVLGEVEGGDGCDDIAA